MLDAKSLVDVLIQCATLIVLGVLVALLVRLLRFRHRQHVVSDPRTGAVWALCAICIGWVLVTALLFATGNASANADPSHQISLSGPGDVVGQLIVAAVALGPIFLVMYRRQESLASAGVFAHDLGRSLVVSVFLVSAVVCWVLIARDGNGLSNRVTALWALLQFAIVGFAEEFAYRGYLQTRLTDWLGAKQGWVLASILMAMAHVGHRIAALRMSGGEALLDAVSLIPISLFLGYVMLRTRSIVAPGFMHTAINWLN